MIGAGLAAAQDHGASRMGTDGPVSSELPRSPLDPAAVDVRVAALEVVRPLQLALLRPDGPLPGDEPPPARARYIAALAGSAVVGAASVHPTPYPGPGELPDPTWQLRGMVVRSDVRGRGIGRRVLECAVRLAHDEGAAALWAAARIEALRFYGSAGWTVVGPEWIKPGIGPHRYITLKA